MAKAQWYVDWFNSPYYHLLYNNRNYQEANLLIDNLCSHLKLKQEARIWDVACGKGRHALAFAKKGFMVTGTDLSVNSIASASKHNSHNLDFYVHDMRTPFKVNFFDAAFNLFTSIGYFHNPEENLSVFRNVSLALKMNGIFVIDFFNAERVKRSEMHSYTEKRGEVDFNISKRIERNAVIKRIEFEADKKNYYFEESVSLFGKNDFEQFARQSGIKLQECFGSYYLETFEPQDSERLIMIFKKQKT